MKTDLIGKSVILVICAVFVFTFMFSGCAGTVRNDFADAESFWWENDDENRCVSFYDFALMPRKDSNAEIQDYYFRVKPELLNDAIQLYVNCVYSAEDYAREVDRLENLECIGHFTDDDRAAETSYTDGSTVVEFYKNETKYFDDGTFNYPAYAQGLEWGRVCEYALLIEEEYRIVYVYLQYEYKDKIAFDKQYLPNGGGTSVYAP